MIRRIEIVAYPVQCVKTLRVSFLNSLGMAPSIAPITIHDETYMLRHGASGQNSQHYAC